MHKHAIKVVWLFLPSTVWYDMKLYIISLLFALFFDFKNIFQRPAPRAGAGRAGGAEKCSLKSKNKANNNEIMYKFISSYGAQPVVSGHIMFWAIYI